MPIAPSFFHLRRKGFSRKGGGVSTVALAAYRCGRCLLDPIVGTVFDFSEKPEVGFVGVWLPEGVPEEHAAALSDPEILFSSSDLAEDRAVEEWCKRGPVVQAHYKATTVRAVEDEISLPNELTKAQLVALVADLGRMLSAKGEIVLVALHMKPGNLHVHILRPTRKWAGLDFGDKMPHLAGKRGKEKADLRLTRAGVDAVLNRHLFLAGYERRVDHRSYEDLGIGIVPTVHEGRGSYVKGRSKGAARNAAVAAANRERLIARPEILLDLLATQRPSFTAAMVRAEFDRRTDLSEAERAALTTRALDPEFAARLGRDGAGEERYATAARGKDLAALTALARRAARASASFSLDATAISSRIVEDGLDASEAEALRTLCAPTRFAWLAATGPERASTESVLLASARALRASGLRVEEAVPPGDAKGAFPLPAWDGISAPEVLVCARAERWEPAAFAALLGRSASEGLVVRAGISREHAAPFRIGTDWHAILSGAPAARILPLDAKARARWESFERLDAKAALRAMETEGAILWSPDRHAALSDLALRSATAQDGVRRTPVATRAEDVCALIDAVRAFEIGLGRVDGEGVGVLARAGELLLAPGDRLYWTADAPSLSVRAGDAALVLSADPDEVLVLPNPDAKAASAEAPFAFRPSVFPDFVSGWALSLHDAETVAANPKGRAGLGEVLVCADPSMDAQQARRAAGLSSSARSLGLVLAADRASFKTVEDLADALGRDGSKTPGQPLFSAEDMKAASGLRRTVGGYLRLRRQEEELAGLVRAGSPGRPWAHPNWKELCRLRDQMRIVARVFLSDRALWRPWLSEVRVRWEHVEAHAWGRAARTPADKAAIERVLAFESARVAARAAERPATGRPAVDRVQAGAERDRLASILHRTPSLHAPWAETLGVDWTRVEAGAARFEARARLDSRPAASVSTQEVAARGLLDAYLAARRSAANLRSDLKKTARRKAARNAATLLRGSLGSVRSRDAAAAAVAADKATRPLWAEHGISEQEIAHGAAAHAARSRLDAFSRETDPVRRAELAAAITADRPVMARHVADRGLTFPHLLPRAVPTAAPKATSAPAPSSSPLAVPSSVVRPVAPAPVQSVPPAPLAAPAQETSHAQAQRPGRGIRPPRLADALRIAGGPAAPDRGRLLHVSELSLARLQARSPVLLPRPVRDGVAVDGRGADHGLRRALPLSPASGPALRPTVSWPAPAAGTPPQAAPPAKAPALPPAPLSKEIEDWRRLHAAWNRAEEGDALRDSLELPVRQGALALSQDASAMALLDASAPSLARSVRALAPSPAQGVSMGVGASVGRTPPSPSTGSVGAAAAPPRSFKI